MTVWTIRGFVSLSKAGLRAAQMHREALGLALEVLGFDRMGPTGAADVYKRFDNGRMVTVSITDGYVRLHRPQFWRLFDLFGFDPARHI